MTLLRATARPGDVMAAGLRARGCRPQANSPSPAISVLSGRSQ